MAECPGCSLISRPHCTNVQCKWRYCRICDAIFDPAKKRWWSSRSSMNDDLVDWNVQLDRCLMNAACELTQALPETFDERMGLAFGWMNLADSWSQRQGNEVEYQKWCVSDDESESEDA